MSPPATFLFSLKIILISTAAISVAIAIKFFSSPSMVDFNGYDLRTVWNSLLTWLKPPYLYFIINGIIVTIAASSRFNHHRQSKESVSDQLPEPLVSVTPPPPSDVVAAAVFAHLTPPMTAAEVYAAEDGDEVEELKPVAVNGEASADDVGDVADGDWRSSERNFSAVQKINSPETPLDFILPVEEKPLLSSRFGHRKPLRATPEGGRALRVARPKKQETLESTWKIITEGRHVPLTRHLNKSDTSENHSGELLVNALDHELTPEDMPKSETFKDRTNYGIPVSFSPIPRKIKKEPSLSQDELNRRVEAFIKKFNEEMRLQRQESLNRYMEMINRGAY